MLHKIELTEEMLLVLSEALMLVPYGKAAPVVNEINRQLELSRAQVDQKKD